MSKIPSAKECYTFSCKKKEDTLEYKQVYQLVCDEIQKATKQSRFRTTIDLEQPDLSLTANRQICDNICKELRSKHFSVNVKYFTITVCWDFED